MNGLVQGSLDERRHGALEAAREFGFSVPPDGSREAP